MDKAKILASALLLAAGFVANQGYALDQVAAQEAIDNAVVILDIEQDISVGSWGPSEGLKYVYTAAAVEALKASNQRSGSYYGGIAWLENHNANNVDLKARKIMSLVGRGNNIVPDLDSLHTSKRELSQTGFGLSAGYYSSPLETALVLQALEKASDNTNQSSAVAYLVAEQNADGGWSMPEAAAGNYWITAEVVIALNDQQSRPGVSAALTQATNYLTSLNTNSVSTVTHARVALALFQRQGLSSAVDAQMVALLNRQLTSGDWGDTMASAHAITSLSYALGLNTLSEAPIVNVDQEQLRTAINVALGHSSYGRITQADVARLTSLDLRRVNIANLVGLENATGLTQLQVNSSTNLSAVSGLSGLNIVVDSDIDNIADANDNCPTVSNGNQANLDGDPYGDVCDEDIDNDQMPNSWENIYAFNSFNAGDGTGDADSDTLINRDEYSAGTDPRDPDSDGDTLDDGVEVANGLDPLDASDAAADFDNDDLNNIEEIALGTDLNDADTDNDNTNDGEEVLVGRNPLLNEPVLIVIISTLLN